MAKKIQIVVNAVAGESIYMCGNIRELGEWDPKKAVQLNKNEHGLYTVTKVLPENQMIEFKFMSKKDWNTVEKGAYDEEINNHILVLPNDEPQVFYVAKFKK